MNEWVNEWMNEYEWMNEWTGNTFPLQIWMNRQILQTIFKIKISLIHGYEYVLKKY